MEHEHATVESDTTDDEGRMRTAKTGTQQTASAATVATATVAATRTDPQTSDADTLPNTLTLIGRETPSSFELTVDGDIKLLEAGSESSTTVVSGSTVEGTIETGTIQFQFDGDLTDVTFVDSRITGLSPVVTPNVHVDYADPEHSES